MENVRSLRSSHLVNATFKNTSRRNAELYWVDFSGKLVQYCQDLGPGKELEMTTFVTHPWVARDCATGHWLSICGKPVYVTPMPGDHGDQQDEGAEDEPVDAGSLEIVIHIPVYRLEDICIGFLRKHLQTKKLTEEQLGLYLLNRVCDIPTLSARVYHPTRGITDQ